MGNHTDFGMAVPLVGEISTLTKEVGDSPRMVIGVITLCTVRPGCADATFRTYIHGIYWLVAKQVRSW
jgi:hypothetical protein